MNSCKGSSPYVLPDVAHSTEVSSYAMGYRLWWLFWGWGSIGCMYTLTCLLQGDAHLLPETVVDRWISYNQGMVWPYLSFFVLIPAAYLLSSISEVKKLARQMQCAAIIAGAIYLAYPTTLIHPEINTSTWSGLVTYRLVAVDLAKNCMPSLHVTLSALAVCAVVKNKVAWQKWFFAVWLLVIVFSTMALKRHLLIDVVSGAVFFLFLVVASRYAFHRPQAVLIMNK